jgi:hypothetical protein
MRNQKLMFLFTLLVIVSLAYSCKDDEGSEEPIDCSVERSYSSDVVPIVSATCAIPNCHVSGFNFGDYTSYDDLKAQDDMNLLRSEIESGAMPPSNTAGPKELTDSQKAILLCWIEQGALNN